MPLLAAACSAEADAPSASSGAGPAGGLAVVDPQDEANPTYVDMGHIVYGQTRERTVRVRNTEDRPLTIRSMRAGCSCTAPVIWYEDEQGERVTGSQVPGQPVITLPPGVVASIDLHVDTRKAPIKNQHKRVLVRITTDSELEPFTTLEVMIFVDKPFMAASVLDLGQVPTGGGGSGSIDLLLDNEREILLVDVLESPPEIYAGLREIHGKTVTMWTLDVRLLAPVPLGFNDYVVLLRTTGPDGEGEGDPFEVRVHATGVPDVQVTPQLLLLAPPAEDQPVQGAAELICRLPGHRVLVTRGWVAGDHEDKLRVELLPRDPDDEGRAAVWDIRIVATQDLGPDEFGGSLLLEVADPQAPGFELRYLHRASS